MGAYGTYIITNSNYSIETHLDLVGVISNRVEPK